MNLQSKFNPEIFEYIKEIASKIKNNRASVMVGAGFSKNAEQIVQTDKKFLDWNSLGNVFYEKVNGHLPGKNDQYLNVLKLAEEVEAAFGRTVLNEIIRDSLPDAEYAPSTLHEKLLNLGWKDVFTTNYDTLLERTLEKITDKHYSVILNKEDLIYSSNPRIIKLHGSFPSTLPFIITEEDYRQYPKNSAIFVNTVQQTLIENALCLVGFSGDDPNFLQWIGWIRDNIGKDIASKIYLVGIFNFSTAQLNLLNKRNIVVLNMANCPNVTDHYTALELFFDALTELTKEEDSESWPKDQIHHHIDFNKTEVNNDVETVIKDWAESRKSYPGWLIAPSAKRKSLLIKTNFHHLDVFYHIQRNHLDPIIAFNFLYEYNWRINKCLMPILKSEINIYEKVLYSINPFPGILSLNDNELIYAKTQPEWKEVYPKWIDLYIDLLRSYRENGIFDKFEKVLSDLELLASFISPEQSAKIHCEKVRKQLFAMNLAEANKELQNWPRDISLPAFEIQRAGLLIELGDLSQALKILSEELSYIRKSPVKEVNLFRISVEAYLVILTSYAKQALRDQNRDEEEASEKKLSKIYDAYAEIKLFEASLTEMPEKEIEKEEYDLHRITRTIATDNSAHIEAFQFVRFFEEIGRPFNCNHIVSSTNACLEAIKRINPYAPLWSMILEIKVNDNKIKNNVWTRNTIFDMSNEEIENTTKLCIRAIKDNLEYIEESNHFREANFQLGIAAVLPEILSRLCYRMSDEMKLKTLEILDLIYRSKEPSNFKNLKNLARRLIESMSERLKIENFNALMKTYLYEPEKEIDKLDYADIFEAFNYQKETEELYKTVTIEKQVTEILLQLLEKSEGREIALTRLFYLYNFGLLRPEEITALQKNVWDNVNDDGLPKIPNIYSKKYILDLPAPEDIDVHSLIKNYILGLKIPKEQKGVTTFSTYNKPLFLLELETCTRSFDYPDGIKWSDDEFAVIVKKILDAWVNDISLVSEREKENLESSELFVILFDKYKSVDKILSQVILSNNLNTDNENLKTLLTQFNEYHVPCLQLRILVNNESDALDDMYDVVCGSDIREIVAACNAIYTTVSMQKEEHKDSILELLKKLSLNVRIRRKQGLVSVIYLFHNLLYSNLLPYDDEILNNLLFGLDNLITETKLNINSLECTTNHCLQLRAASTSLAYILYSKFTDKTEITSRLRPWKELSVDLKEFSEIRNKWLDN